MSNKIGSDDLFYWQTGGTGRRRISASDWAWGGYGAEGAGGGAPPVIHLGGAPPRGFDNAAAASVLVVTSEQDRQSVG